MDTLSSIFSLRSAAPAMKEEKPEVTKISKKASDKRSERMIKAAEKSSIGVTKSTHSTHSNAQIEPSMPSLQKTSTRILSEYIYLKKYIETASCTKNKLARMVRKADFEVFNQSKFLRVKVWSVLLPDINPFWAYPLEIGQLYQEGNENLIEAKELQQI